MPVRVLTKRDLKSAAYTLAEAFNDDDLSRYFTHTPDRADCTPADHWRLHLTIMKHVVRAHIYSGLVTAVGENNDCVALW